MYKKLFTAPIALTIALSAIAPTMAHAEETAATTEVAQATAVTPTILYKGVPTANYNAMFANTEVVKDGDVYKVTMDVSSLFTLFQVNGKDVVLEKGATDKDLQKVTFTIASLEEDPTIKIAYTAGPMGVMSHEFTFDFTPTVAEVQAAFDKAIATIKLAPITTAEELKVATAQISAVDNIVASAKASNLDESAFVKPAVYAAQQEAIAAYKAPFTTKAADAFSKLTFTAAESITTKAQLAEAKVQLEAAQAAIAKAVAAGLTERADLASLAGYANVAAQKTVVEAAEKALAEEVQTVRTLSGKVSNAKGASDIVKVYGLQKGDTVRLYNAKGKMLKTATATGEYLRISGVSLGKAAGKVYVSAQAKDEKESAKKAVAFKAEPVAKTVAKTQISVKNNKGKADVVTVKGTAKGQKIRVYNEAGKSLKTVTATSKTTKISIKQLGKATGKISVARIQDGKHISAKTTVKFSKEQ
ncbi:hypothetical protein [Kurthia sp. Dielmo]|uniref:hypothetical protein n=1 Tax=Kurthia sp. Dielmo TaxID=1033738 RepID=UPI00111F51E9|nr:hypothetical protein [Kurthia sp. Dielmo]